VCLGLYAQGEGRGGVDSAGIDGCIRTRTTLIQSGLKPINGNFPTPTPTGHGGNFQQKKNVPRCWEMDLFDNVMLF